MRMQGLNIVECFWILTSLNCVYSVTKVFELKAYKGAVEVSLDPRYGRDLINNGYQISYQVMGTNHQSHLTVPPRQLFYNVTTDYPGSFYILKFYNSSSRHPLSTQFIRAACIHNVTLTPGQIYFIETPGYPGSLHPGILCKWNITSLNDNWVRVTTQGVANGNHSGCPAYMKFGDAPVPTICDAGQENATYVVPDSSLVVTFMSRSKAKAFRVKLEVIPELKGPTNVSAKSDADGIHVTWDWNGPDFDSLRCAVVQAFGLQVSPKWDIVNCSECYNYINTSEHRGQTVHLYMIALTSYWHSNKSNDVTIRAECSYSFHMNHGAEYTFSSADSSHKLTPNSECHWTFGADFDSYIKMVVHHIDIGDRSSCSESYLQIQGKRKYCGVAPNTDKTFVVKSNILKISTKTTVLKQYAFNITFKPVDSPTLPPTGVLLHANENDIKISWDDYYGNKTIENYLVNYNVIPDSHGHVIRTNGTSVQIDTSSFRGKMLAINVASETEGGISNFTRQSFIRSNCGSSRSIRHKQTMLIASPSVNGRYQSDIVCKWAISTEKHLKLLVNFENVSMELSPGCSKDYVQTSALKDRICGNITNSSFVSKSNNVRILFVTDESNEDFGFIASATALLPAPGTPEKFKIKTTPSGILVRWDKPSIHPDYVTGYTLFYKVEESDDVKVTRVERNASHYLIDTSCTPGVGYRVWGVANGEAEASPETKHFITKANCGNRINLSNQEDYITLGAQENDTTYSTQCEWTIHSAHPFVLHVLETDTVCNSTAHNSSADQVALNVLTPKQDYPCSSGVTTLWYSCVHGTHIPLIVSLRPVIDASDIPVSHDMYTRSLADTTRLYHRSVL